MAGQQVAGSQTPWYKKPQTAAIAVVLLIIFAVYIPQMVNIGGEVKDNATKVLLPPSKGVANESNKTIYIREPVYVPGSMPLGVNTDTYGENSMMKKVEDITYDAGSITTEGIGRAATPEEFAELCRVFKNSTIENRMARGVAVLGDVFWKRNNVWAGYFATNKDKKFLLVLVQFGDKPEFVKVDTQTNEPATKWRVWEVETEKTEKSSAGRASQVFLCAGG